MDAGDGKVARNGGYLCSGRIMASGGRFLRGAAALEMGADGIRVNMLHPNAVFGTGIWTDEVLQSRADNYGMTIDEYKRNNILHTDITSHDVADLVLTVCGESFAKTTGAQVPIDGGNDRVI